MQNDQNFKTLFSFANIFTITITSLCLLLAFTFYNSHSDQEPRRLTVAITQIVQHPSLDQIRKGLIDQLRDHGYVDGENINIIYENAQGNISTATQIAQKFIGLGPDVIVGITTPSAQTLHAAMRNSNIPLVFAAVTDPIGAQLIEDIDVPSQYVTGTIDLPPLDSQVKLMRELVPSIETIGVIYNPGEINSILQIDLLQQEAHKHGIQLIKSPAVKSSEVYGAAVRLADIVDLIYIPNDNAIVSAIDSIARVAREKNIPTMASDDQSPRRGILVGFANSQYHVGRDTGMKVVELLKGTPVEKIPVTISNHPKVNFNYEIAEKLEIKIPEMEFEPVQQ